MANEHTKGVISEAQGKVEDGFGALTGNRRLQAEGRARQVKGAAQKALGTIQDAARKPTKPA